MKGKDSNEAGAEATAKVRSKRRLERLVKAALMASLTAGGAQIAVPIDPVPVTLQMLFVFLAGYILLLGAVGLLVFARFSGGFVHLFGPTAGYLWAFPL